MYLHKFVNFVANPLGISLLFAVVGLVLLWRGRRFGRVLLLADVIITCLMGLYPVGRIAARWLERDYPIVPVARLPPADAIVLLGGGVSVASESAGYPYSNLNEAADRAWHAARIWHEKGEKLKIYCTCPDVSRSTPPFLRDLGVASDCIVPIDGPWNTAAEAQCYETLLREKRVYLVTSALHMKRAVRIFEKYAPNLEIVPAAIDHVVIDDPEQEFTFARYVPNPNAYFLFGAILHEYLGLVRYW